MKSHGVLGFGMGLLCGGVLGSFVELDGVEPLPEVVLPEILSLAEVPVPEVVGDLGLFQPAVLVIDVREPERAAAVRAAIEDERVVAESAHGFALRERRLVVSSLEAAGAILGSAGWEGAGLMILRFEPVRRRESSESVQDAQRLAELMQRPTLTYFEAQQALALL